MNVILVWLLNVSALALAGVLFALLTLACEAGYRLGRWRGARYDESARDSPAPATLAAGMLGLLAFILGLTINFAQNRFEARRNLVNAEANAIDTAYLRARMVGGPEGDAIADLIQRYAATRLAFTVVAESGPERGLTERTSDEEAQIWALATKAVHEAHSPADGLMVTALNDMFDAAQSQRFAFVGEPPDAMLDILMAGSILTIGAIGFQLGVRGGRQRLLTTLLLLMWTGGMVVTVDLGRARLGQIQVDPRPLQWSLRDMRRLPPLTPAPTPSPTPMRP